MMFSAFRNRSYRLAIVGAGTAVSGAALLSTYSRIKRTLEIEPYRQNALLRTVKCDYDTHHKSEKISEGSRYKSVLAYDIVDEVERVMQREAIAAYEQGNYQEALTKIDELCGYHMKVMGPYGLDGSSHDLFRAIILEKMGRLEEARKAFLVSDMNEDQVRDAIAELDGKDVVEIPACFIGKVWYRLRSNR